MDRYYSPHLEAFVRSGEIALQMLSIEPTTLAGVAALLRYGADHVEAGYLWPDDLTEVDDLDGDEALYRSRRGDLFYFLNRNLAEAPRLAA